MEFYEVINNRKTIREFEDEVIPADIIEKIITAAFKAPTNDHIVKKVHSEIAPLSDFRLCRRFDRLCIPNSRGKRFSGENSPFFGQSRCGVCKSLSQFTPV